MVRASLVSAPRVGSAELLGVARIRSVLGAYDEPALTKSRVAARYLGWISVVAERLPGVDLAAAPLVASLCRERRGQLFLLMTPTLMDAVSAKE
jgi:hypothetical protein